MAIVLCPTCDHYIDLDWDVEHEEWCAREKLERVWDGLEEGIPLHGMVEEAG